MLIQHLTGEKAKIFTNSQTMLYMCETWQTGDDDDDDNDDDDEQAVIWMHKVIIKQIPYE